MRTVLFTAGLMFLAACTPAPDATAPSPKASALEKTQAIVFPQVRTPSEVYLQALAQGRLVRDGECLFLDGDSGSTLIVWPYEARLDTTSEGQISITQTATGHSVRVGDEISLGGHGAQATASGSGGPASASDLSRWSNVAPVPPADCLARSNGAVWYAGEIYTTAEFDRMRPAR